SICCIWLRSSRSAKRCMQYVINNKRTACRVSATLGHGLGGVLAVVDVGPAAGRADALRRHLVDSALPAALSRPCMVGAHLVEADAASTTVRSDEKKLLQTPDAMARWLVLLEGVEAEAVTTASAEELGDAALLAAVDGEVSRSTYQLSFVKARPG